jgi:hypothetical protein
MRIGRKDAKREKLTDSGQPMIELRPLLFPFLPNVFSLALKFAIRNSQSAILSKRYALALAFLRVRNDDRA